MQVVHKSLIKHYKLYKLLQETLKAPIWVYSNSQDATRYPEGIYEKDGAWMRFYLDHDARIIWFDGMSMRPGAIRQVAPAFIHEREGGDYMLLGYIVNIEKSEKARQLIGGQWLDPPIQLAPEDF